MAMDFENLLSQLECLGTDQSLAKSVPSHLRQRLVKAARSASIRMETPAESMGRILLFQPIEGAVVRVAADAKVFTSLAVNGDPKTIESIAQDTKIDSTLLSRLLKCLGANDVANQTNDGWVLNPSFALFANPSMAEAYGPCERFLKKMYEALPEFLSDTQYKNPVNDKATVIQSAFNMPEQSGMQIIASDQETLKSFSVLMSTWQDGFTQLHSLYPVEQNIIKAYDGSISEVSFVDVGGGFGQKTIALRVAFPSLPGKMIVQDLPYIIAMAPQPGAGIELVGHDFFTEQPVKGAKVYYVRQCLHNWTDEKCVEILMRLKDAMRPGYSKLLIHEIIMPERDAGLWPTTQDIEMMNMFASLERSEQQWRELLAKSGLHITTIYPDANVAAEGIIEAEVTT